MISYLLGIDNYIYYKLQVDNDFISICSRELQVFSQKTLKNGESGKIL